MNDVKKAAFKKTYHFLCSISAIVLIIYCVCQYVLDKDVTQIEFRKFHVSIDSYYPSITICFEKPLIGNKLREYDPNITYRAYKDFLNGLADEWNENWSDIDYDNVTIKLQDHLRYININLLNNYNLFWDVDQDGQLIKRADQNSNSTTKYDNVKTPNIYVSSRSVESKCFTIDIPIIPNERIYCLKMEIDADIFPLGNRPSSNDFFITINYPKQVIRSLLLSRVRTGNQTLTKRVVSP